MTKAQRHGELAFNKIKKLPKGLTLSDTKVIAVGSGGNAHSIDNGQLYLKQVDEYIIGYLATDNTKLFHSEHSPQGVAMAEGDGVYEIRKGVEIVTEGLKQISD